MELPASDQTDTAESFDEGTSQGLRGYLARPLTIVRKYRRADLTPDVIAGVTVAAVAIPQAIAYASIAELPPQTGLWAAVVAAIVGSLWGSSRHLATGPVNAVSLLTLPILLGVAQPDQPMFLIAAASLAVMVGILQILLAVLRFGVLVTLASRAVLLGFTAGAAIHIAIGQLKHLLRVDLRAEPELYNTIGHLISKLGDTHALSLGLGLGTLVLLILLRRLGPRVPAALDAITAAGIVVVVFGLDQKGVHVVGAIPRTPPPFTWTSLAALPDLSTLWHLMDGALAVTALALVEAVASAQVLARRSGQRLDSNQEFFGQGLANVATGMLSGYPCSGSFTRSSLAQQVGGRSNLTGVITGLAVLAGMLALAPYARYIPRASIAAVLLVIAWGMIDREGSRRALRTSRSESAVMAATFVATLTLPLDFAILAGVLFSLAFFVLRSALPRVYPVVPDPTYRHLVRDPDAPTCPQIGIMNIRGPLFFGAVYHIEEELRHNLEVNPGQTVLVLRMHGVDICDLSGIEMLESTVNLYRSFGGDVFLVRPRKPVRDVMAQSGFLDHLGRDHILLQEGAIEFLFDRVIDPIVCVYGCEHRVFAECQAIEKHPSSEHLPVLPHRSLDAARFLDPASFLALVGNDDTVVVDVREPEEYRLGHIGGSILLPLRTLYQEVHQLPRDRTLLVVDRSGRRTARAMQTLRELEFVSYYGLKGGVLAWRAAGLPLVIE
jgi:SulP family sulfate permease